MADEPRAPGNPAGRQSATQDDFVVIGEPLPELVQIRFTGTYRGQPVLWDAQVLALEHDSTAGGTPVQFIEIGQVHASQVAIRIGLAVPRIDLPTLRKTVIMVRNYRRLRPGRHEFHG